MTVVIGGGGDPTATIGVGAAPTTARASAVGRGSRGMLRQSGTRIRSSGGHAAGSSHSALGGQPLAGAEPSGGKLDIKHRFEITGKLGSGTYGKVSLAYDHKTEREVAVKLIKKSAIENKQDLVRIRREIRIMSMLKHPNVIQIYEVFENKDKIILVMEYANGGELYDYVSKFGSLPEAEARRIFRQITSAVLYCHKHKVAHRDLKLENILLDARNNAKIADFGLSNYFSDKNLLATFCGSPLYASPEIINGTPYMGPEVDCWSLGILLYTLVYGSMPFDGRDFNRMVRQIKRGAYYEPDTPSTASMLIRNMLRVNPERRADIDDIASHWWLNLEENMPVIQELPENQITDHTPLTERAEIMVVQDLADETDVFMEFGHLSAATRQKIEEFRRRRKEAEEYNDSSPVKPPKHRRTSLKAGEEPAVPEMTAREKSLRAVAEDPKPAPTTKLGQSAFQDPLDRLRQLESRLQGGTPAPSAEPTTSAKKEKSRKLSVEDKGKVDVRKESQPPPSPSAVGETKQKRKKSLKNERRESVDEKSAKIEPSTAFKSVEKPAFISLTRPGSRGGVSAAAPATEEPATSVTAPTEDDPTTTALEDVRHQTRQYWKMGTDSLNLLMNQVLEQMEKGPVSLNLIARIKAHAFYDQRPMVKELLESIIAAQPASVQKETSKIIQQQSQELIRRQTSNKGVGVAAAAATKPPKMDTVPETKPLETAVAMPVKTTNALEKYRVAELPNQLELKRSIRKVLDDRPWHSVEVGFSTDDETSSNNTDSGAALANAAEEKPDRKVSIGGGTAPKFIGTRSTRSEPRDEFELDDDDEFYDADDFDEEEEDGDEEVYESDIDELADDVELGGDATAVADATTKTPPAPPRIVENLAENLPPADGPAPSPNHLSTTLERQGLSKRQSKGKYQFLHNQVEMYGRGVSMEAESPPVARRRIGGPQPKVDQSPVLFDKAKNYLINYPDKLEDSDPEEAIRRKSRSPARGKAAGTSAWLQTRDPSASDNKSTSSAATTAPHSQEDISQKKKSAEETKKEKTSDGKKLEKNESEDEEEEEETDDESASTPFRPRPSTIIGFRTIQPIGADGVRKEAPIVKVKPQAPTNVVAPTRKLSAESTTTTNNTPPKGAGLDVTRRASYHRRGSGAGDSFDAPAGEDAPPPPIVGERQKHESASAYIRRKNRERRARNQTIAVTSDEVWTGRAAADNQENHYPDDGARRKSSLTGRLSVERTLDVGDHRPSYGADDRRYESNYWRQAYVDRRKSFQEMTPQRAAAESAAAAAAESRCFSPLSAASAYDRYGGGGYGTGYSYRPVAGAIPTSMSRYEDEIYHAFYPNSALHGAEPNYGDSSHRRFEVYRTRAERASDATYGAPSYRNGASGGGGYYSSAVDRPSSAYVSEAYRRYDDNNGAPSYSNSVTQRRSLYDTEPTIADYGNSTVSYGPAPPDSPNGSVGSASNGRRAGGGGGGGVVRRMSSTSRDDARRLRARSQSTDRLLAAAAAIRDDIGGDPMANDALLNARLMAPEVGGGFDYGCVAYHDSAGGRLSAAGGHLDVGGPSAAGRSILRNKTSFDSDARPSYLSAKDSASGESTLGPFGRLRRHLSVTDRTIYGASDPLPYTGRKLSVGVEEGNSRLADVSPDGGAIASAPKKHSFLNLTRRRTTEVTANSILPDDDYKRPRSPIDRLKSFFRPSAAHKKDGGARDSSATSASSGTGGYTSAGASSRYTSSALGADIGYGGYTPASSATKRYGGATSSSRYGFTGSSVTGAKSSPRSWYDDPHHY